MADARDQDAHESPYMVGTLTESSLSDTTASSPRNDSRAEGSFSGSSVKSSDSCTDGTPKDDECKEDFQGLFDELMHGITEGDMEGLDGYLSEGEFANMSSELNSELAWPSESEKKQKKWDRQEQDAEKLEQAAIRNGKLPRPCVACRSKRVLCNREYPCKLCKRLGIPCTIPDTVKKGRPTRVEQQARAERAAKAAAEAAAARALQKDQAAEEIPPMRTVMAPMSMAAAVASNLWGGMDPQPAVRPSASSASSTASSEPPPSPPTSPPEEAMPTQVEQAHVEQAHVESSPEPPLKAAELTSVYDLYPARLFRGPRLLDVLYSILVAVAVGYFLDRTFFFDTGSAAPMTLVNVSDDAGSVVDSASFAPGRRLAKVMEEEAPAAAVHMSAVSRFHFEEYSSPWPMTACHLVYICVCAALSPGAPIDRTLPHLALHGISAASVIGRGRFTYEYYFQICDYAARKGIDDRVLLTWQVSLLLTYATSVVRLIVSLSVRGGKHFWAALRLMFITNTTIMLSVLAVLTWFDAPYTAPPLWLSRQGGLMIAAGQALGAMIIGVGPTLRYQWAHAVPLARFLNGAAASMGKSQPLSSSL